jgi:hypothetical protein
MGMRDAKEGGVGAEAKHEWVGGPEWKGTKTHLIVCVANATSTFLAQVNVLPVNAVSDSDSDSHKTRGERKKRKTEGTEKERTKGKEVKDTSEEGKTQGEGQIAQE